MHRLTQKITTNRSTLQNRANKVKDRVLGCGTNNELISLYAEGKVTEVEINWIKANLLSYLELTQLAVIEGTRQGNLFYQEEKLEVIEWEEIKEEIDSNMKRLGWSEKRRDSYFTLTLDKIPKNTEAICNQLIISWK